MGLHEVCDRAFHLSHPAAAVPAGLKMNANRFGQMRRQFTIRKKQQLLIRRMNVLIFHGSLTHDSKASQ
jgi:hypothetical protein